MDTLALKEWSAAVHALLAGRQTVLLRKGGVGEKRFAVRAPAFLLFPTVAHSHAARVRPEFHDLLAPAARDSTAATVTIRAAATVVAAVEVRRPDRLAEIADTHVWTLESVHADRLDFRPRHPLTVLVVAARPLHAPVELPRLPQYRGCVSWVDLPVRPALDDPVLPDDTVSRVAERVRATLG